MVQAVDDDELGDAVDGVGNAVDGAGDAADNTSLNLHLSGEVWCTGQGVLGQSLHRPI